MQILQFRSKRWARCWLVVSVSMLLKTSRGAALRSGAARTASCCSCNGNRPAHVLPPGAPLTGRGKKHLASLTTLSTERPLNCRSRAATRARLRAEGEARRGPRRLLTSESDTGGESPRSGAVSCLAAGFLLSLCSFALGSITCDETDGQTR